MKRRLTCFAYLRQGYAQHLVRGGQGKMGREEVIKRMDELKGATSKEALYVRRLLKFDQQGAAGGALEYSMEPSSRLATPDVKTGDSTPDGEQFVDEVPLSVSIDLLSAATPSSTAVPVGGSPQGRNIAPLVSYPSQSSSSQA